MQYDDDFAQFCRNASDDQLQNILRKEWEGQQRDADREGCYLAALVIATERGWTVNRGEVA